MFATYLVFGSIWYYLYYLVVPMLVITYIRYTETFYKYNVKDLKYANTNIGIKIVTSGKIVYIKQS